MKKALLILASVAFSLAAFAQDGVKWEAGSLQEALDKAAGNKKGPSMVFLNCYLSWGGSCKMMAEQVFPTKVAGEYFNKRFVNIKIDMEKGEGPAIEKKYGVSGYPTFLILDAQGNEIGRVVGDVGGSGPLDSFFIERVENVVNPSRRRLPEVILERYRNSGNMKDAYAYMQHMQMSYREDKIAEFVTENYDNFSRTYRYSNKLWEYLTKAISLSNTEVMEKIIADKTNYESALGKDKVNTVLYSIIHNELLDYLLGKKDISDENVLRGCELHMFLADGLNNFDELMRKLARAKVAKDHEEFARLIDGRFIGNSIHAGQMRSIQRMLFNNPDVPDVEKARFVKEYKEFLQKSISELEKLGEQYKDVEVPQRKSTGFVPMNRMN